MASAEFGQAQGLLTRAAGMVAEARDDFDAIAARLSGQIAGAQGRWVGAGADAFFRLHASWDEKQRRIVSALNDFERSLVDTERDNVAADESESATYSTLVGKLG